MCAAFALGALHIFQIWYGDSWGQSQGYKVVAAPPVHSPSGAAHVQFIATVAVSVEG